MLTSSVMAYWFVTASAALRVASCVGQVYLVEMQPLMLDTGRLNVEVDDTCFLSEQAAAKRFANPRTAPGDQTDPFWHYLSFLGELDGARDRAHSRTSA